ncbi:MAG: YihY/virulence factor BrkB family protein [Gemmatimonadota bacterium]|nr:YihY/virulence factor BrkB family protein [Gemmatimonadota bacterium]
MDTYDRLRANLRRDRPFLLASAIAYNALLTAIPLLLLVAWGLGVFAAGSMTGRLEALEFLERMTPLSRTNAHELLGDLVAERSWIGAIGAIALVWTSTRLSTSLRQVLEIVFEVPEEKRPGWFGGKLHDARLVLLGGTLFALTAVSSSALHWVGGRAATVIGIDPGLPDGLAAALAVVLGLLVSIAMFYVLYRYVPNRRVAPYDAALAAVFAGVLFEIAKQAFVLWIPYSRQLELYGALADVVAAALWTYYSALVFVVGAEIARTRRDTRKGDEERGV